MRTELKPRQGKVTSRGTRGAFGKSALNRVVSRSGVTLAAQCAAAEIAMVNTARAKSGLGWLTADEVTVIRARHYDVHGDRRPSTKVQRRAA